MFSNRSSKPHWLTKNCSRAPQNRFFFYHWPQQRPLLPPPQPYPPGPPVEQVAFRLPYPVGVYRPRLTFTQFNPPSEVTNSRTKKKNNFATNKKRPFKAGKRKGDNLNPTDPLNLQDLMKESERRRMEGLSPLRGDSRLNTPAGSYGVESPKILDTEIRTLKSSRGNKRTKYKNYDRRLPITGNYPYYYNRRDPTERLKYLMPEWFIGKDVADYGCHNGTMAFAILERFPEIQHIDGIDCDSNLIDNARCMQREKIRLGGQNNLVDYEKIFFRVANWGDVEQYLEEPQYDTIIAFSVTKWIHLNGGDAGLMRFFRRAFNLLKPGGHLILEPQPKMSYRKTRLTQKQKDNYNVLKIDPSNFESILLDLGFSYFDHIKIPQPNQPFKRVIMLCSKSYGATPASIRNDCRDEAKNIQPSWLSPRIFPTDSNREPPPVDYCPQTPNYVLSPNSPHIVSSNATLLHTTATSGSSQISSSICDQIPEITTTAVVSSECQDADDPVSTSQESDIVSSNCP